MLRGMRIQSFANTNIFWRAFNKSDTVYIVGLAEGIVSPGQAVDWNHPREGELKLELKLGDISGEVIMPPGRVFANGDGAEVHDDHYVVQTRVFTPALR